ncbi:sortase family protein [Parvimonas sp. oral taxon 110 str. F0139]|nr:sortase family protein [Parvimonas sp. oral taxon 110 str. F0139]
MLQVGELIGHVEIPKIDENLPIYAGTSEDILQKGAGHLEGSSLPVGGEGTHSVITAHRGLPTAALFTKLDKLQKGDVFFIHNIQTVLAYEVDQILVVEPSDFSPILVESGKDYVTLLTCTPYMVNSHRLLVRGHRIEYTPLDKAKNVSKRRSFFRKYFYWLLMIFIIALIIFLYNFKKYMDVRKRIKELKL